MIYTHVLNRASTRGIRSPADALWRSIPRASPDTRQLRPQRNYLPWEIPPPDSSKPMSTLKTIR